MLPLRGVKHKSDMIDDINGEYVDDAVEINSSTFDTDFDDVGFDPIEIDDSDKEMEEYFGLND